MRIALILPGAIWFAPYVRIYTRILDEIKADYSIISWNRDGNDSPEGFQYNNLSGTGIGSAGLKKYFGYLRFIITTIKKERFERLIIFGPQTTCLLSLFLLFHPQIKFMIDYRDLSIEQKGGLKQIFSLMLKKSRGNVISSPGFKRCLPKGINYLLSHNFDETIVRKAIQESGKNAFTQNNGKIDVLTIGGIRDLTANLEVVNALGNKENFQLRFVGKGNAAPMIEEYCKQNNIQNISFVGFYKKNEEAGYIENATFLNIFYPRIITHDTALSNRFYNSLIYKKPMIVTKNTIQGDYAENYKVGVAVENCKNLSSELNNFINNDFESYSERCNRLLATFLKDQELFVNAVRDFAIG